jgi:hypothetical protein
MLDTQGFKIKSVNIHQNNNRTHTLLQKDDADVLLIQEPSFIKVATLCSDTNPLGEPQMGAPANDQWDCHVPPLTPDSTCKALIYTRKQIQSIVTHNINHLVTNYATTVVDINDHDSINIRIINVYHDIPPPASRPCHALQHITSHETDLHQNTLLIGDFNTHARLWSLPNHTLSSWANHFTDWIGDNGFTCLNPRSTPTWNAENARPSIIDLVFANEPALISTQISLVTVSWEDSLGSDHAAISLTIFPTTSTTLIPPPSPSGYHAKDK